MNFSLGLFIGVSAGLMFMVLVATPKYVAERYHRDYCLVKLRNMTPHDSLTFFLDDPWCMRVVKK